MTDKTSLSYKDAGVDIDAGNALVERIKGVSKRTRRPEVLGGLGGFGALCQIPAGYKEPVLVRYRRVGTKLRLAIDLKHDTVGIDLVAMCVNDLIVQGAEPSSSSTTMPPANWTWTLPLPWSPASAPAANSPAVPWSAVKLPKCLACMKGRLRHRRFLRRRGGKERIIDGSKVGEGDALIALAASGPHSNGFSLIRKILEVSKADVQQPLGDTTLANALLEPTRIYVKPVLKLIKECGSTPCPTSPAAASGRTSRACCPPIPRRSSTSRAGSGRRCSAGCNRQATSPATRCIAPSTAASA